MVVDKDGIIQIKTECITSEKESLYTLAQLKFRCVDAERDCCHFMWVKLFEA